MRERTDEWFKTRVQRAEAGIRRDAMQQGLNVNTLMGAMREISSDPPSEESMRLLAEALGWLRVDEYWSLLDHVSNFLRKEIERGTEQVSRVLDQTRKNNREPQLISEIRNGLTESYHNGITQLAGCMQALIWGLIPPKGR